jgi:hypothetical protein
METNCDYFLPHAFQFTIFSFVVPLHNSQQLAQRRSLQQEACVLFVKYKVITPAVACNFSCRKERVKSNIQLAAAVRAGVAVDRVH